LFYFRRAIRRCATRASGKIKARNYRIGSAARQRALAAGKNAPKRPLRPRFKE
jgi:hypothetical protein